MNGLPIFLRGIEYNDLELAPMGVIRPQSAYSGGPIRWLEPRLTVPLRYEVGLFVAFSRYDFIFFGFQRDHRKLIARRSYQRVYPRASLGRGYRPLAAHGFNGVQLRIVRRGDQYHCQARYDTDTNDRDRRRVPGLFDDLDNLPGRTSGSFERFRTIETLQSSSIPRAVGLYVLTTPPSSSSPRARKMPNESWSGWIPSGNPGRRRSPKHCDATTRLTGSAWRRSSRFVTRNA